MDDIARVRRFNRNVTQHLGVLNSDFLGRNRSTGASRVLFEVGARGIEIRALRDRLGLDSGYASRLVGALEREGLVEVGRAQSDARVRTLKLTRAGRRELSVLNDVSDEQAVSILEPLSAKQRRELVSAMQTVERFYLASSMSVAVEDPRSTSAAYCIQQYYRELAERFRGGFDPDQSISATPEELEFPGGCLIVARILDEPVGCGALKFHTPVAEVKRMWVSTDKRGAGIGKRILTKLEEIATDNGIEILRLETNASLKEAQSMYAKHGYREVPPFNDEPYAHHWFEKRL